MKNFDTLFRADEKWEHLKVEAKNKKEAIALAISTYEGFKKSGFIKDYRFMSAWEVK